MRFKYILHLYLMKCRFGMKRVILLTHLSCIPCNKEVFICTFGCLWYNTYLDNYYYQVKHWYTMEREYCSNTIPYCIYCILWILCADKWGAACPRESFTSTSRVVPSSCTPQQGEHNIDCVLVILYPLPIIQPTTWGRHPLPLSPCLPSCSFFSPFLIACWNHCMLKNKDTSNQGKLWSSIHIQSGIFNKAYSFIKSLKRCTPHTPRGRTHHVRNASVLLELLEYVMYSILMI